MPKAKSKRTLKTAMERKSVRNSNVKKQLTKSRYKLRRSPGRAPLPKGAKRSPQMKNSSKLKKSKGGSRRIELIDANPGKITKKVGDGTNVIFLATDSARRSDLRIAKSPVFSPAKIGRLASKLMNYSKAREGVDFFCNLGQRILQSQPTNMLNGLHNGERVLAKGMVRRRPMVGRLEAGRLKGGGLRATVVKVNEAQMSRAVGLGSLCPGPVLNSTASLSAKDVVVPLTNRLPIIDFISTNEFNKIN
ncbi:hypothetical protein KR032_007765, partial [Drosophila birchii]